MWQENEMCCLRVYCWTYHSLLTAIKILFLLYAAEQQEHELLGIPSVSSVLPMAHQSALVANATHPSHAMFAAATLGHHGMFDSNLGAQDGKFSLFDFQQHLCVNFSCPTTPFFLLHFSFTAVCVCEREGEKKRTCMNVHRDSLAFSMSLIARSYCSIWTLQTKFHIWGARTLLNQFY